MSATPKKLYIKTYGCQMNAYDSTRMADVLAPLGYQPAEDYNDADMVILNTCHIREKAEEKVYSDLGRVRQEKLRLAQQGKRMLVAVGGCVAQAEGDEVIRRAPYVDMVFGSQSYHQLAELVTKALSGERSQVELDFPPVQKFDYLPQEGTPQGVAAFLAVQEGCDKFCTFCVVPYTRGAEYSRKVTDVEQEARRLVAQGAVEIMLLGQNVNAYHGLDENGDAQSLAQLIRRLAVIEGLKRLRYTTSHPRDMQEDLMQVHTEVDVLMPYLHLPVQSGSDRILKAMNRKHTASDYMQTIERLRQLKPDMAFSGDFIVGFPGETEEDFLDTLALVNAVGYASAYSFKYSPRPGTPASSMENQVAEEVKDDRLQRLQAALQRSQLAFNEACVGKEMDVLLDREGKLEGQLVGRSPYMQSVCIDNAQAARGSMVRVRVEAGYQNSLFGVILG